MSANPYLEGNFAPVLEERSDFELSMEGTILPELTGATFELVLIP